MYSIRSGLLDGAAHHYDRLRRTLVEEFPSIDDQTLSDTLEGLTDLREILSELIRSALEDEALLEGLSTRLNDLKARQKRLAHRAEVKRGLALKAMAEAQIKSLTEPDFSAFLRRAPPALDLLAEEKIPPEFWKPQPSKLDRHGLLEALKAGTPVEGARLLDSQIQLSVRTR